MDIWIAIFYPFPQIFEKVHRSSSCSCCSAVPVAVVVIFGTKADRSSYGAMTSNKLLVIFTVYCVVNVQSEGV
jgi:hypothetical protein